jgi:hypothetical protein
MKVLLRVGDDVSDETVFWPAVGVDKGDLSIAFARD